MQTAVILVFGASLVTAGFCIYQLIWHRRFVLRTIKREDDGGLILYDRLVRSLLAALVLSLALAAATALIDAKVSDASEAPETSPASDPPPARDEIGLTAEERDAFAGKITKHDEVPERKKGKRLCAMRYGKRQFYNPESKRESRKLAGKWWTSCHIGQNLVTVADAKEDLALPARFGAVRDVRVRAQIPVGTPVTYYEGFVAPKCEHESDALPCFGHRYQGGGWQYLIRDPAAMQRWVTRVECTRAREDRRSRWVPCAG